MNRYIRGSKANPELPRHESVGAYTDVVNSENKGKKIPKDLLNFTTSGSCKSNKAAVPPIIQKRTSPMKRYKDDESKRPHQMVHDSVNEKQPIDMDKEIYNY